MYLFPIKNAVITRGYAPDKVSDKSFEGFHAAIDIAPRGNDSIVAPMDSVCAATGFNKIWGNFFVLRDEHDREFGFAHCDNVLVDIGDKVYQGEEVAICGNTGNSDGKHLHLNTNKPSQTSIVIKKRMVESKKRCENPLPLFEKKEWSLPQSLPQEPVIQTGVAIPLPDDRPADVGRTINPDVNAPLKQLPVKKKVNKAKPAKQTTFSIGAVLVGLAGANEIDQLDALIELAHYPIFIAMGALFLAAYVIYDLFFDNSPGLDLDNEVIDFIEDALNKRGKI